MFVNKLIAPQFANLIRACLMINNCGVLGVVANSTLRIAGLEIVTAEFLSYLIEPHMLSAPNEICVHTIKLNVGTYTIQDIFDKMRNVKVEIQVMRYFQALQDTEFVVVTGNRGFNNPFSEQEIDRYFEQITKEGCKYLRAPYPFLCHKYIAPKIDDMGDGRSKIEFKGQTIVTVRKLLQEICTEQ